MFNGVETMKLETGEEEEVKQPRVTKAQKRRVRFYVPAQVGGCSILLLLFIKITMHKMLIICKYTLGSILIINISLTFHLKQVV